MKLTGGTARRPSNSIIITRSSYVRSSRGYSRIDSQISCLGVAVGVHSYRWHSGPIPASWIYYLFSSAPCNGAISIRTPLLQYIASFVYISSIEVNRKLISIATWPNSYRRSLRYFVRRRRIDHVRAIAIEDLEPVVYVEALALI